VAVSEVKRPLRNRFGSETATNLYGWIGHERDFLCTRQNLAHRDRRGLFSIHKKYGLLNRRPKKDSFFYFD
jgi:hypothetical protein